MTTLELDPDALRVLEIGRAAGGEPFETGSVKAARAAYNASFPTLQGEHEPTAATLEQQIDGPNGAIPIRIHRGIGAPQSGGAGAALSAWRRLGRRQSRFA
jgi:acetyl esterase